MGMKEKKSEKRFKIAESKKLSFSKSLIRKLFMWNFFGLVLKLVSILSHNLWLVFKGMKQKEIQITSSLLPTIWNIGILLHKHATLTKHIDGECNKLKHKWQICLKSETLENENIFFDHYHNLLPLQKDSMLFWISKSIIKRSIRLTRTIRLACLFWRPWRPSFNTRLFRWDKANVGA